MPSPEGLQHSYEPDDKVYAREQVNSADIYEGLPGERPIPPYTAGSVITDCGDTLDVHFYGEGAPGLDITPGVPKEKIRPDE